MSADLANKKPIILRLHRMLKRRERALEGLQNKNRELRKILANFRKKSSPASKTKGRRTFKRSSTTKKTRHKTNRARGRRQHVGK